MVTGHNPPTKINKEKKEYNYVQAVLNPSVVDMKVAKLVFIKFSKIALFCSACCSARESQSSLLSLQATRLPQTEGKIEVDYQNLF